MEPYTNYRESIITEEVFHKGEKRIKLIFKYNPQYIELVKTIPDSRWSRTMNAWHIPFNDVSKTYINELFSKGYSEAVLLSSKLLSTIQRYKKIEKTPQTERIDYFNKFEEYLRSNRYSDKTIHCYKDALAIFLKFYSEKDIETITNEDIIKFNHEYILRNGYSCSFQNQIITAVKLFFRIVEKKAIVIEDVERPRKQQKLPDILSQSEVESILKNTVNVKHRAMMSLIYACGLRRSELINLQLKSIDSSRKLLLIKEAKGKKDRVAPLPERMIEMLREYYKQYKPKYWLFEGEKAGERYTESSLQQVFKQAIKRTKIKKHATLHTLRHSYATHLLEGGTDLRYIQEILGHKNSKTTELYTHVTTKSIERIKSPFENLTL